MDLDWTVSDNSVFFFFSLGGMGPLCVCVSLHILCSILTYHKAIRRIKANINISGREILNGARLGVTKPTWTV